MVGGWWGGTEEEGIRRRSSVERNVPGRDDASGVTKTNSRLRFGTRTVGYGKRWTGTDSKGRGREMRAGRLVRTVRL